MEGKRAHQQTRLFHDFMILIEHDLRASAADIDEQSAIILQIMRRTDEIKDSLLITGEDPDIDSRTGDDLMYRLLAVFRIAQSRCRKRGDIRNAEACEKFLEFIEHLTELINALLLHLAILQIRCESYHVLFLHEHFYASAVDLIDCHADSIGTNVNNCLYQKGHSYHAVLPSILI